MVSLGTGRVVSDTAMETSKSLKLMPNMMRWYVVDNRCEDRAIIRMTIAEESSEMHPVDLAMDIPAMEAPKVST